ncbi:fungal-specific transcription factor domain-containing protein [Aspergillus crustosus]
MARHRKIVCSACRKRKSKCNGASPACSSCIASNSRCEYEKAPSIAYVRALQERIRQLEKEPALDSATSTPAVPPVFNTQDGDSFSINARGDVSYHNPTSAIHEAPVEEQSKRSALPEPTDPRRAELRQALVANAATQKSLESLNLHLVAPQSGIPEELATTLLQLHWCWLHPMFLFVYRPAFTRDMLQLSDDRSSYCSRTLLQVLYAHSCRFIRAPETIWNDAMQGESFPQLTDRLMSEARISLAMETFRAPSIPTIQALLQQSARDVASGRSSQAWLFSGMAFRMAIDLGLHVSTDKLQHYAKSLTPEDIEIRKRLFWSLYAWDKHISLYLGRMPNFLLGADNVPLDFLDDFSEDDPWEPFYGPDPRAAELPTYQPTAGHINSCFTAICRLCIIVSRLMLELCSSQPTTHEGPRPSSSRMVAFARITDDLTAWWTGLLPFLRIPPENIPHLSPPPHITSLNLMYHTVRILLHRPHVAGRQTCRSPAVQQSWKICQSATTAIYNLLKMYVDTFGYHHITYMNSYCTYTAATTAVYQLETDISDNSDETKSGSSRAWTELKFLLDILQHTATAMPVLERSIDIIRTRIKKILDRQAARQLQDLFSNQASSSTTTQSPSQSQSQSRPHSRLYDDNHPTSNPLSPPGTVISPSNDPPFLQQTHALGLEQWESWLPAFPGQEVFYGSESLLDVHAGLSPDARSALMGANLDPHVRLDFDILDGSLWRE